MDINWFPGHMAKSTREIEGYLKSCDCALYVLDSRAVRSCFNPEFDKMIAVPIVYVLNKTDLVDSALVADWIKALTDGGNIAVAVEGTSSACKKSLLGAIKKVCAATLEKQRKRGLNEHLRAVVLGVPNTGKSTVINSLCSKARLITGDKAGVTRASSWARVDQTLDVLDTPGTLYPKITDRTVGENLAMIGSIKDEILDTAELGMALIKRLNAIDTQILEKRFGTAVDESSGLQTIAQKRGYRLRGGEFDTDRAAAALIDDFRKGRLGKIGLERAYER